MTDTTKLTEEMWEDFLTMAVDASGASGWKWFESKYGLTDKSLKQLLLGNQAKLDKITAFAKNLAYSNPHVSWQLKQLLRDAPSKTITYKVSCSKCPFEQDHEEVSLEKIKQFHEDWNDNNKDKMKCVHDYEYTLIKSS